MEEEKSIMKKKLSSRKFLIWIVWLVIVVLMFGLCIVVSVLTKKLDNAFAQLIDNVLGWFFAISMMYMGVNVGQKGISAIMDFLAKKEDKKPEGECQ